jgi:bifunctional DNA-binding transcriptional regulator/antitoxin component of YhaV-PrlF toxin-antitoxin module
MRLTSKGQVTIPLAMRKRYGLDPLAEVTFEPAEGGVLIRPATNHRIKSLRAALKRARGSADAVRSTAELMRLTRGED